MDAAENTSPTFADVSLIIAACAGKSGHCGIAYVDLEETERVLYVADVMDPEFAQLDRALSAWSRAWTQFGGPKFLRVGKLGNACRSTTFANSHGTTQESILESSG